MVTNSARWGDSNCAETFTEKEAESLLGKTVKTVAGEAIVCSLFCDGPNEYILLDDCGMFIYKSHNNCNYLLHS